MRLFREHVQGIAAGTVIDYLRVKPGEQVLPLKVRRIAAWNDTAAVSIYAEVGIGDLYNKYVLARDKTPLAAGKLVSYDQPFILPPDMNLYAAFNVASASDVLHMFVMGEYCEELMEI